MRKNICILIAGQVWRTAFKSKAVIILLAVIALLLAYGAYSGVKIWETQQTTRLQHEKEVRHNWENMPDKHPHRMAHYGYIAFRPKSSLSYFDFGLESYTGNAVFLEAHKQNTVNFSEAGFSTGLLRFGEISMALVLQVLVPLLLFFLGFNTIAADRENNTLKILLSQGASWPEIIAGKSAGLMGMALLLFLPAIVITILFWLLQSSGGATEEGLRLGWLLLFYTAYFAIISVIAVTISAISKTSKLALISLISIWLLFTIVLPRATQAFGNSLYPAPSKIELETVVEKELIQKGDSHNPNDPYYKALKDSLLRVYKVSSPEELPFNYSGFIMKEGEKLSSEVYQKHLAALLQTHQKQNNVARLTAFINPYLAIKNLSMALSGTDFNSYVNFQNQAEDYRYQLAQNMNELQIKLISNKKPGKNEKGSSISKNYWKQLPDFHYQPIQQTRIFQNEILSIGALLYWLLALGLLLNILSKKLKAI
jgi:ABC-2 type transport system permease protein